MSVWAHPLRLRFRFTSPQGWPRLMLTVLERDAMSDTDSFSAYGMACLPNNAGTHLIEVPCWRPLDRRTAHRDSLATLFSGSRPMFRPEYEELVAARAGSDMGRTALDTVGVGRVVVRVQVMMR